MTRNKRQCIGFAMTGLVAGLVLTGTVLGCSASDNKGNGPTGGSGGMATGTGGSGGAPTGSGGAPLDAQGGSGGAVSTTDAGDAAGNDGNDGLSPSGTRGTQGDPGATGDGTSDLNAPYVLPPESLMHLNGAPTGKVTGLNAPQIYASKAVYAGLKFQYWVYVPAQYKPGQRAALAVVLDGHHYLGIQTSQAPFHAPVIF